MIRKSNKKYKPASLKNTNLKINRADFLFLSFNSIFASVGMIITLRFKTQHTAKEIKKAMAYMLSVYPKLRSVVKPTLFSNKVEILDFESKRFEVLFQNAFSARENLQYNTEEYFEYRRALMNESFSLEHGLPIKIRYLSHSKQPVLLISMHHMAGDGKSWLHMADSLMSYLNGTRPPLVPPDNPSLFPALAKKPYKKLPRQLYESFLFAKKEQKENKNEELVELSQRPVNFFGPTNVHQHLLSYDYATLYNKAKELGCSVYVMLLAAMSLTCITKHKKGNTIGILTSMDLRPFFREKGKKPPVFGNYVRAFMLKIRQESWTSTRQIIRDLNAGLIKNMYNYRQKKMIYPYFLEKTLTFLGIKFFTKGTIAAKKNGRLPMTFHWSDLGNLDNLNSHGEKAQLSEAIATVPNYALFFTSSTINGKVNTNISYPEAEFTLDEIKDIVESIEKNIGKLLKI